MTKKDHGLLLAVTVALLAGCGSEDRQAPTVDNLVIEKAPEASGDKQVGIAGRPLDQDLVARVTTPTGRPLEGVTVYWITRQGSMDPGIDVTDADGLTASRWTTLNKYLEQEAYASVQPVNGPWPVGTILPGMIQYTALAYPDPNGPNTIHVVNDRFEPANLTVPAGARVNWYWPVGSVGHNVVPDDGNQPATSGAPAGYPKFLSFQFGTPGVYRYHCAVHGGPGGAGMSGTVTVVAE